MSAKEWKVVGEEELGIGLVSLRDPETGFVTRTPLIKPGYRSSAAIAWAGARFSRSADSAEDIFREMYLAGTDAEAKLAAFFRGYGHASVADMAPVMIYIEQIPIHLALDLFYASRVNAGQERSTRFQDFSSGKLPDLRLFLPEEFRDDSRIEVLDRMYQDLGRLSNVNYVKWTEILMKRYTEYYRPDPGKQIKALQARTFDSSRFMLLAGFPTSIANLTSAREWSRQISRGKGSRLIVGKKLADQVENLLAPEEVVSGYIPEVASLIRHTATSETTADNLNGLKAYLSSLPGFTNGMSRTDVRSKAVDQEVEIVSEEVSVGQKMAIQYVMAAFPGCDFEIAKVKLNSLSEEELKKVGAIIFSGHDHLHIMGNMAEVTGMTAKYLIGLGEARDFDRQRGQGRFIPALEIREGYERLLDQGFILPLYLDQVSAFSEEKREFVADMTYYFDEARRFVGELKRVFGGEIDTQVVLNLLPLGTAVEMVMHSDPKQEVYFDALRVRNGVISIIGHWLMKEPERCHW